jgi:hypothetical protein
MGCGEGCGMLRILRCLDSRLTDGGEIVNLMRRPRLELISFRGWVNPQATVWLEVLRKLKKYSLVS